MFSHRASPSYDGMGRFEKHSRCYSCSWLHPRQGTLICALLRGSLNLLYLSALCAQAIVPTRRQFVIFFFLLLYLFVSFIVYFFIIILQGVNRQTITNLLPGTSYKLKVIDFRCRHKESVQIQGPVKRYKISVFIQRNFTHLLTRIAEP